MVIFFKKNAKKLWFSQKFPILLICRFVNWKKLRYFSSKISTLNWSAYPSSSFWYKLQGNGQHSSAVAQHLPCITDFVTLEMTLFAHFGGIFASMKKKHFKKIFFCALYYPKSPSFVVKMSYATGIFSLN